MSQRLAIFRADASAAIGAGHLVRSLALAEALRGRGFDCCFAVNAEAVATVPELAGCPHRVVELARPARAAAAALQEACAAAASVDNIDWLIVDHYGLDQRYETACRAFARRILAIDDLADRRHDCDVLLDQTPGRRAAAYDGLVGAGCQRLLGPDYALLRRQFAAARGGLDLPRQPAAGQCRILVSLGMTDPDGLTLRVLDGIALSGTDAVVDVVLGAAAPDLETVRRRAALAPRRVTLHTQVVDMAALMSRADIAIGAGGVSALERCCLGLPSVIIVAAENQAASAAALAACGACAAAIPAARVDADSIATALGDMQRDAAALVRYSEQAAAICDGAGVGRVADLLAGPH